MKNPDNSEPELSALEKTCLRSVQLLGLQDYHTYRTSHPQISILEDLAGQSQVTPATLEADVARRVVEAYTEYLLRGAYHPSCPKAEWQPEKDDLRAAVLLLEKLGKAPDAIASKLVVALKSKSAFGFLENYLTAIGERYQLPSLELADKHPDVYRELLKLLPEVITPSIITGALDELAKQVAYRTNWEIKSVYWIPDDLLKFKTEIDDSLSSRYVAGRKLTLEEEKRFIGERAGELEKRYSLDSVNKVKTVLVAPFIAVLRDIKVDLGDSEFQQRGYGEAVSKVQQFAASAERLGQEISDYIHSREKTVQEERKQAWQNRGVLAAIAGVAPK